MGSALLLSVQVWILSAPDGVAAQADVVWSNIAALLTDVGMTPSDIVSVTTYVVAGDDLGLAVVISLLAALVVALVYLPVMGGVTGRSISPYARSR